jgi:acyl dehydratase
VCAHLRVGGVKAMPRAGGGLVQFDVKLHNQHGELVQSGTWKVLIRSRHAEDIDLVS